MKEIHVQSQSGGYIYRDFIKIWLKIIYTNCTIKVGIRIIKNPIYIYRSLSINWTSSQSVNRSII